MIRAVAPRELAAWRDAARALLARDVPPEDVTWEDAGSGQLGLGWESAPAAAAKAAPLRVPARFVALAGDVLHHRDADRFALLYRLAFRLTHGEPALLEVVTDPDVLRVSAMADAVRRDVHRTHAFVRFRRVELEDGEHFVAYHVPDHPTLRLSAPFFARRFAELRWSILTPAESARWDGSKIEFGPGAPPSAAPEGDALEDLFRTYYRAVFNPARLNLAAMRGEMPTRHWSRLPETRGLAELVRRAPERVDEMRGPPPPSAASAFLPSERSLDALRAAAARCTACPLHLAATQTVFGEGPSESPIFLVGEQPGDEEDRRGRPFAGPAGAVLERALEAAGIRRDAVYVTNAVKHFKWRRSGKRRLHERPAPGEVRACRAWLDAEIERVRPAVIVCLGVTAAESFLGRRFSLNRYRGRLFETPWARGWLATYHPAAILRAPDDEARERLFRALVDDLREARAAAGDAPTAALSR